MFLPLLANLESRTFGRQTWAQPDSWALGVWTLAVALFPLALMTIIYLVQWRREGLSLRNAGIVMGGKQILLTLALSAIVVITSYSLVFIADFWLGVDFRFYEVLRVTPFRAEEIA